MMSVSLLIFQFCSIETVQKKCSTSKDSTVPLVSWDSSEVFESPDGFAESLTIKTWCLLFNFLESKIPKKTEFWLVVSIHLKNISQNGNLPQIGVKIRNISNHHLENLKLPCDLGRFLGSLAPYSGREMARSPLAPSLLQIYSLRKRKLDIPAVCFMELPSFHRRDVRYLQLQYPIVVFKKNI